jgi:hypothetical protein
MASSVAALRALIEQRFPDAVPITRTIARPVASGILELDRALPKGGFPLARLSVCAPYGGSTAILRATCRHTCRDGERAAWVDAGRTIAGAFWTDAALLVRPRTLPNAVRAASELLHGGGFRLVVLSGAELAMPQLTRLVRAAHEGGGAFILLAEQSSMAALRLSARITPEAYRWDPDPFGDPAQVRDVQLDIHVRALGWNARARFPLPVQSHELRLALESGLADRRGLPRSRLRAP